MQRLRDWLAERKIDAVIPHKDNERARHDPGAWFDKLTYRDRNMVEQCVGWLRENRCFYKRFAEQAANFSGMLQLAMIKR